jgi:hypothetical protein
VKAGSKRSDAHSESVPLAVDLDGTLLRTDLPVESALLLIKQKPWFALLMPLWLLLSFAFFLFLGLAFWKRAATNSASSR